MICPTCDHENREDARFCDSCGQLLTNGDSSTATTSPPSSGSALAISFVSGRYGGKHLLGEVGKKRDYLAHDTLLDRDVAFALIETESLDDVGRARIIGEAQALGRLGNHPNVVTVFDLCDHEGQPYEER